MKMTGERFIPNRMHVQAEIEHMHRYHAVGEALKNRVVLDAACGTGYGSAIIAEKAGMVYGMDIDNEAVAYAQENYGGENVCFKQGSLESLPFPDGFFDAVVSFETIEHVGENIQKKFLEEICRVLKPDGFLIMSTPDKKIYTDEQSGKATEWHVKEFYSEEFHQFLQEKFGYVKWYQQYIGKTSSLVSSEENYMEKINYDEKKEGKFIVAIASKKPGIEKLSLSSSYYCPELFSRIDDFIQVYYPSDSGAFTEDRYQMKEISTRDRNINERVWLDGQAAASIRIDPLASSCQILIKKIELGLSDGQQREITEFTTNADKTEGRHYLFYHRDPQIIFTLEKELNLEYIDIHFEIEKRDIDLYPYYKEEKESAKKARQRLSEAQAEAKKLTKDNFIQVYYRHNSEEFTEKRYQLKEISTKNKEIKEHILLDGKTVTSIRIDPLASSCEILVKKIVLGTAEGQKIEAADFKTNADKTEGNQYWFYHRDPQIIITLEKEQPLEYIDLHFEIKNLNIDIYPYYKNLEQMLKKAQWEITEKQAQLEETQKDDFIQIYYRTAAEEFSEDKYQMKKVFTAGKRIDERIVLDTQGVKAVRIDPLASSCRIVWGKIVLGLAEGSEREIQDFLTNADRQEGNHYLFYHRDPQIIFELPKPQDVAYIDLCFEIEQKDIDLYPIYEELVRKLGKNNGNQ